MVELLILSSIRAPYGYCIKCMNKLGAFKSLIFSLIDIGKPASFGESFKNYIHARGGVAWVFGDALPSRDIDYWNSLRWKNDGHFNVKGNLQYAKYLHGRIAGLRDSSGEESSSD